MDIVEELQGPAVSIDLNRRAAAEIAMLRGTIGTIERIAKANAPQPQEQIPGLCNDGYARAFTLSCFCGAVGAENCRADFGHQQCTGDRQ